MRSSPLIFATLIAVATPSSLRLSSEGANQIVFGANAATAATLSAHCGSAELPTVTCLSPRQFNGHSDGMNVKLLLGNVAPTCIALSTRRIPCAVLQQDQEDPFVGDPLFYCKFHGAAESAVTGPVYANATTISSADPAVGYRVTATCPVPPYETLLRLGPYDGAQEHYTINVSVSYWSPSATEFNFEGAPGGDTVTFVGLPAPPPPAPPSNPPFTHSSVYVHYGARSCSSGSETLYSGFVAGAHYTTKGSTSSRICMHPEPQAVPSGWDVSASADIYGVEWEQGSNIDHDAACAVCQRTDAGHTYVQWGRSDSCSNGHTTLYTGTAMTEADSHQRTEMVCVDRAGQGHSTNNPASADGALWYAVEMQGGGSGASDQEQYPDSTDIGCSVCAVPA